MSGTSKTVVSMCVLLLAALVVYYGMTPPEEIQGTFVDIPKQRPSLFGGDAEEKLIEMGFPPVATKLTAAPEPTVLERPAVVQRPEPIVVEIEPIETVTNTKKITIVNKTYKIYTVLDGETLGEIASRELGSYRMWREIASLNNISDPSQVNAGRVLRMPKPKMTSTTTTAEPVVVPTGSKMHVVVEGDTLSSIAGDYYDDVNKYGVIQKANPSVDPNTLKIGQRIVIPSE